MKQTKSAALLLLAVFVTAGSIGPSIAQGVSGPYLAARQASMLSDYDEAARYYEEALRADSSNVRLLESAMVSLMGRGDMTGSAEMAQKYTDAGGEAPIATLILTANAISEGDFSTATGPSVTSEGLTPLVDGLVRGWAFLGEGQASEASDAFATVAETGEFSSFAHYHEALSLAMVGDFEAADEILSGAKYGALTLSSRGIEAHAQILAQLERFDDAKSLLSTILQGGYSAELVSLQDRLNASEEIPYDFVVDAKQGVAEVFFNIAAVLNGRAQPEHILLYARLAQYLRPDHATAILTIANTLEDLGQYDLATTAYSAVSADHPAYFLAEMGRADALRADDREDAAIEVLKALSKSNADIPMVHAALGDMLSRARRDEEAIAAYTTSLEMRDPDDRAAWPVYYARGIVHERNDDLPNMEVDFRKALELNPDQPDVLNYLGYSLVEQRVKFDEALAMIETAVERKPESGYIVDSLAWVLYRLGRYEEAVEPMERAAELLPIDPIINDHLGDIYWKVGRVREAEFQWKRALSFEPEEDEAERIRRKLDVGLDAVLEEEASDGTTQTAND